MRKIPVLPRKKEIEQTGSAVMLRRCFQNNGVRVVDLHGIALGNGAVVIPHHRLRLGAKRRIAGCDPPWVAVTGVLFRLGLKVVAHAGVEQGQGDAKQDQQQEC